MLGCRCCRDFREELAGLSAATFVIEDGHIIMVRSRNFIYWIAARHWFVDSMLPVGHIVSCRGIGGLR
jgi:hypothetical protein